MKVVLCGFLIFKMHLLEQRIIIINLNVSLDLFFIHLSPVTVILIHEAVRGGGVKGEEMGAISPVPAPGVNCSSPFNTLKLSICCTYRNLCQPAPSTNSVPRTPVVRRELSVP